MLHHAGKKKRGEADSFAQLKRAGKSAFIYRGRGRGKEGTHLSHHMKKGVLRFLSSIESTGKAVPALGKKERKGEGVYIFVPLTKKKKKGAGNAYSYWGEKDDIPKEEKGGGSLLVAERRRENMVSRVHRWGIGGRGNRGGSSGGKKRGGEIVLR